MVLEAGCAAGRHLDGCGKCRWGGLSREGAYEVMWSDLIFHGFVEKVFRDGGWLGSRAVTGKERLNGVQSVRDVAARVVAGI